MNDINEVKCFIQLVKDINRKGKRFVMTPFSTQRMQCEGCFLGD